MINGVCPVNPLVVQMGFKNDIDAHRVTRQMWLYYQYYFELIVIDQLNFHFCKLFLYMLLKTYKMVKEIVAAAC